MTPISERGFDATVENHWTDRGDRNFSIVQDPTAPISPPNVGQARYPAGFPSGSGPVMTALALPDGIRTLYVCYWTKVSSNWTATAQVTKDVFFHIGGGNGSSVGRVYSGLRGASASMSAEIDFQGMGMFDNSSHERQVSWNGYANLNRAASILTRGSWAKWEILLKANTPGQYDGEADWWLNGVWVGHYTKIGYSGPSETGRFNSWLKVVWNPTWGGSGRPVLADQYMWKDHIYVSGK